MIILDVEDALQDILSKWRICDLYYFRLYKSTGTVEYGRKGFDCEFCMSDNNFEKFIKILDLMDCKKYCDLYE